MDKAIFLSAHIQKSTSILSETFSPLPIFSHSSTFARVRRKLVENGQSNAERHVNPAVHDAGLEIVKREVTSNVTKLEKVINTKTKGF